MYKNLNLLCIDNKDKTIALQMILLERTGGYMNDEKEYWFTFHSSHKNIYL